MTPEQFRTHGHQVIDWVADYMESVESYPVMSRAQPGSTRANLPASAPETGEVFERILRDLNRTILPGVTHWQSPNFFAYFPSNASPASILGDLVSSGLGVQGMMWATSPACTELETHVLDWLVDAMGLPASFRSDTPGGGVIQDTASSSTLCAMLAARERATAFRSNGTGDSQGLVAYTSNQAHSSVLKAARIAGIGSDNVRLIEVDESYAMRVESLQESMAQDHAVGLKPFFVCATIGTTASTAVDPVRAIAGVCDEHKVWLHVDAAYAGNACVCPEFRNSHDGVELADSYVFNPHKWLLTNFDCSVMYVRDRLSLIDMFSITPEYLKNAPSESGAVIDYRDWHIPLGRRFRALKLWFVIRHYGLDGLREHVRGHVALAREFADWIDGSSDFELSVPATLGLVCFRHRGGDDVNQRIMDDLNAGGSMYLTHASLDGRKTLRLAIGSVRTERRHVVAAWEEIQAAAARATASGAKSPLADG